MSLNAISFCYLNSLCFVYKFIQLIQEVITKTGLSQCGSSMGPGMSWRILTARTLMIVSNVFECWFPDITNKTMGEHEGSLDHCQC